MEELIKNQTQRDAIRENFESFCGLCDISLLDILRERVDDINQEWQRIEDRLRSKVADLQVPSCFVFVPPSTCTSLPVTSVVFNRISHPSVNVTRISGCVLPKVNGIRVTSLLFGNVCVCARMCVPIHNRPNNE